MNLVQPLFERRWLAALIATTGVVLTHSTAVEGGVSALPRLVSLLLVGCGVALLVWGAGVRPALGTGAVFGACAAIGLSSGAPVDPGSAWAFLLIATGGFAIVGAIAGTWDAPGGIRLAETDAEQADRANFPGASTARDIAIDLQAFVDGATTAPRKAGAAPRWPAFADAVRGTLTDHTRARRVDLFHVSDDDEFLLPITDEPEFQTLRPARQGLVGEVLRTGRVFNRSERGGWRNWPDVTEPWSWLFPLRARGRTYMLVGVESAASGAGVPGAALGVIRDQLQLAAAAVTALQTLEFAERNHDNDGVLTRHEMLTALDRAVREAHVAGQSLQLLVVGLEGVRALDDRGFWKARDELLERVGGMMRRQIVGDVTIGRFAEDTFMIFLHRAHGGAEDELAERVWSGLAREFDEALPEVLGPAPARALKSWVRPRVASAGAEFRDPPLWDPFAGDVSDVGREAPADGGTIAPAGRELLLRAMGLLNYARKAGLDLISDQDARAPRAMRRTDAGRTSGDGSNAGAPAEDGT